MATAASASTSEQQQLDERKSNLKDYFGPGGFERWRKIYSSEQVSYIRRTVREGHAAMVSQALAWAWEGGTDIKVLDAGCGPGVVSRAIARSGGDVVGCDLAEEMVEHCRQVALTEPAEIGKRLSYIASDLETVHSKVEGPFDLVICLDVLIYYPEEDFGRIIQNLATLSPRRIIFTYAPASFFLRIMHKIGRMFPHGHRSTSLEIIGTDAVRRGLAKAGMRLTRQKSFSKGFYHAVLAEAIAFK